MKTFLLLAAFAALASGLAAEPPVLAPRTLPGTLDDPFTFPAYGGRIIRLPGFDFPGGDVDWQTGSHVRMTRGPDGKSWRLALKETEFDRQTLSAPATLPLQKNRHYLISALICTDIPRPAEINFSLVQISDSGLRIYDRAIGLPSTDGQWKRWEAVLTGDPQAAHAEFQIQLWGVTAATVFEVADIAFVELPATPLVPFTPGTGATFAGGPGDLPMSVEEVGEDGDFLVVRTSGAVFTFDRRADTLLLEQRIGRRREVARWHLSIPLDGLHVLEKSATCALLGNESLTVGIQGDSLAMFVPHREVTLGVESLIGGRWNRLLNGHLLAWDGVGGFAVNPAIPPGSGRLARCDTGIILARGEPGEVDFTSRLDDQTWMSQAAPGWTADWMLSPGERIAISVFPPRPYPWEQSFEFAWLLAKNDDPLDGYAERRRGKEHVEVLWEPFQRAWAMSWGPRHTPVDETHLRTQIDAIQRVGSKAVPYLSGWFYYSRDAREFAAEVRRLRDRYGFDGVYYDGLPVQDWIVAYEEARLTRELFPGGTFILHHTAPAPLADRRIELPAISAYADATYMGEVTYGNGPEWAYAPFAAQYGKANCIGVMKGDLWTGATDTEKALALLRANGRSQYRLFPREYFRVLDTLYGLWREHRESADFYEEYFLPAFRQSISESTSP